MIRLDTHVVVWLYTGELERFTETAIELLAREDLIISPIVDLELTYLHEIGRLRVAGATVTADLRERVGLGVSEQTMTSVVAAASPLSWTRDPFDRLIVADALVANCGLLTKDATIHEHYRLSRW